MASRANTERQAESALYRRYRPHQFDDVRGQDHVVSVLSGAVKNNAFSHAYLFAGSRGTGKTSVARILADAIGCNAEDLYEIDAASNRGIDDIRELREAVSSLPLNSKYKVYIIDEVHMLTKEAFNALLKTLEEPPEHVVFILATTEPDKLPETVLSRCERHTFRTPDANELRQFVTNVAEKEGYTLADGAADVLALLAEGSYRDAHSILQKVFSASGKTKKITSDAVAKITGAPRMETVNELVAAIGAQDSERGLKASRAAASENVQIDVLFKLLLHKLRTVMFVRHASELGEEQLAQFSDDDASFLKTQAQEGTGINSNTLVRFLDAYTQTKHSPVPYLSLELAIIDVCGSQQESA